MNTIAHQGLTMLQVAALRMPCYFAAINGSLLVGEGVYRGVKATLEFFGFTGESQFVKKIQEYTPVTAVKVMRPHQNLTRKELAISAVACCAIGILGTAFVAYVFGNPPNVYNNVLAWLGPVRLANDTHPVIGLIASAIRK